LEQNVADNFDIVGLGVLAHGQERVSDRLWLTYATKVGLAETTDAKWRLVRIASEGASLTRIDHRWHLHVLLLAEA